MATLWDFDANTLGGEHRDLSDYRGKVVLVVNTASQCGFTPQYTGLEELYQRFGDDGLVVLGFPCNQFGGQEPGEATQIEQFCQVNYGVTFPIFEKVDVNGESAHPLFQWLRKQKRGLLGDRIRWNFTKFLIGRDGLPIRRYGSTTTPAKIAPGVEAALKTHAAS